MKEIIPCIKDKCLLLPVCKHKFVINCESLFELLRIAVRTNAMYSNYIELTDQINKLFPKVFKINNNTKDRGYYIYESKKNR